MEIRRVLRGEILDFAAARPARSGEQRKAAIRPSADRLELSRQWTKRMEEQRAQVQAALLTGGKERKKSGSILDLLDGPDSAGLEAEMEQMKVRQRCMEISRRIMAGKRAPPQDERYLMEHDPEGYKLTIALRKLPKKDEKECESVLKDKTEGSGETGETGKAAPVEGGRASSGGDAPPSGGKE